MRLSRSSLGTVVATLILAACGDSPNGPGYGLPARMLLLDGANQTGVVGQKTPIVPSVLVIDVNNQPVPGVIVSFAVESGAGSVTAPSAITDSKGTATPGSWTLGSTFGTRVLTATTTGLAPVTFMARAIAPDAGIAAFNLADPAGDTLATPAAGLPKAHDVIASRGDFRRDSLVVTLTFAGPLGPVSAGGPAATVGFLELDIDNDANTGGRPTSNSFGASANLGVDYVISLFNATAATVTVEAFPGGAPVAVPATFSGSTLVIRIPFQVLGNDDGNFAVVGVVGTVYRPTDYFPNSGAVVARPGGGGASLSATGERMPAERSSLASPLLEWGPLPVVRAR